MPWNFFNAQMGLLTGILFIWWLVNIKKNDSLSKLKNNIKFKPLILMLLFFVYAYSSLLWTDNIEFAFDSTLKYYKYYWLLVPVLISSLSEEEALNAIYVFTVSIGLYAIFSILIYFQVFTLVGNSIYNPRGILAYAIVSPYMAIVSLSSLCIFFHERNKKIKFIFFAIFLLTLFVLFINKGRAGQISFFITIIILLIVYRKSLFNFRNLMMASFLIVLSIFIFVSTGKADRFYNSLSEFQNLEKKEFAGSWGHRAYMWYAGIDTIIKNPLLGVGVGDNIDDFINYTKLHPSKATWLRSYHNQHLDYLTKFGIIGYSLFLLSILYLIYTLKYNIYYFTLSTVFFSVLVFDSLGDILLLMKPFNNVFMLMFILFSILAMQNKKKEVKN
jgi:O-antigen ligase